MAGAEWSVVGAASHTRRNGGVLGSEGSAVISGRWSVAFDREVHWRRAGVRRQCAKSIWRRADAAEAVPASPTAAYLSAGIEMDLTLEIGRSKIRDNGASPSCCE
jgi:hypothetical protein